MRKFYLINALMLLLTLFSSAGISAAVTTYPYSPDFKSDDGWTKTTTGNGSWSRFSGYWQATFYSGNSKAYLFSPELQTESGSRYTFTYTLETGSTGYPNEKFTVYILKSATATSQQLYSKDYELNLDKQSITDSFSFDSTDGSPIYFCVYDKSDNSRTAYKLKFTSFKVEKSILETKPNMVTGLTAERGANEAMTVALGWTNPATYNTGESLSIKQINIYRNDVLLKSLTDAASTASGVAVSLTDEVPASGYYTYGVEIVDADGKKSATASVRTAYVGPLAAIAPPYTLDFSDAEEMAFWKTINGDNTNNWSIKADHAEIKADGNKSNDDWFVSRPFALDAAKAYKLSFTSAFSNPANEFNLDVMKGSGASAEAMTEQIANVKAEKDKKTVVTEKAFSPKSTGTAYIGWHADNAKYSAPYYYNTLSLSDISIVEIPVVPNIATGVKATPAADGAISVALEWTNPTTSETGLPLTNLSAEIYRDGALVKTIAAVGAKGSFTDTESDGLTKGFHKYYIVIKNGNGATSAEPETVESGFVGVPETVPFVSDFANESSLWTVEDNSKTSTKKSFTFTDGKAVITENSNSDFNDWLITPPVKVETGHTYRVSLRAKVDSGKKSFALKYGSEPTVDGVKAHTITSSGEIVSTDFETIGFDFRPETSGIFYVGLNIMSSGDAKTVSVSDFDIIIAPVTPKTVDNLSVEAVGLENKAKVSFKMPAESTMGDVLTGKLSAVVSRNGAVVSTLADLDPKQSVEVTDEVDAAGEYTYSVVAVTPDTADALGDTSAAATVESGWIGKGIEPPYANRFDSESDIDGWSVASTYSYGTINWSYNKEEGCMQLRPIAYGDKKFWLISMPLCLEKAGIYRLTFDAWMQSEAADLFVYVSSSPDYKTMTTQIGEPYYLIVATQSPEIVFSTAGNADASTPGDISSDAGNYYLGFMATEISNYSNVYLDNIEIEPIVTSTVHTLSGEDMKMYVSNDVLHIVSDTDIDNIQIYAMSGLMLAAADNTNEISLQHLPAGAYVVKIKTDKQIITSKIIK